MVDLLGEVDTNIPSKRPVPTKAVKVESRRKVRVLSPPLESIRRHEQTKPTADLPDTPPAVQSSSDDDAFLPTMHNDDAVMSSDPAPAPSSPTTKAMERKAAAIKIEPAAEDDGDDDDNMLDVAEARSGYAVQGTRINISASRPSKKMLKPSYPTPESSSPTKPSDSGMVDATQWNDVNAKLNVLSSPPKQQVSEN